MIKNVRGNQKSKNKKIKVGDFRMRATFATMYEFIIATICDINLILFIFLGPCAVVPLKRTKKEKIRYCTCEDLPVSIKNMDI